MRLFSVNHWTLLLSFLVPLIPVILLYWLFADLNYFDLEGTAKFVVSAGGPVAAYVFITWLALTQGPKVWMNPLNRDIIGEWEFTSTSSNKHQAKGKCIIEDKNGNLQLSGQFKEGDFTTSSWQSDVALCGGANMMYMHNLVTEKGTFLNIVNLNVSFDDKGKANKMIGHWHGFRDDLKRGEIIYNRVNK